MKTLKYILFALFVTFGLTACNDDPTLKTTDIGPEMKVISATSSAPFGGNVDFEVSMTDRLPLSTLKAQIFFDSEMVAEEVIRTKTNGTYTGTVAVPFFKNIPDGEAKLRFVGQNIQFGLTTIDETLVVSRPKPDHLTFTLDGAEYRMDATGTDYEYAVTADFPQKAKGFILTPELDASGAVVTFGYDTEVGGIVADGIDPIPFSNANAGVYTISFNLFSFEGSPFIKLIFNDVEMTMIDDDNYYTVQTLTQGNIYELTGIPSFEEWNIDSDFFEREDAAAPEELTFLPMTGLYKVTANFKFKYLKVEAMASKTEYGILNDDATGDAIWVIGDTNLGKPTMANSANWNPEKGGLCMARVADKKFQITLWSGVSLNATSSNFKFFWQKTWDHGEFVQVALTNGHPYGLISTTSNLVELTDGGNVNLVAGKTFDLGGVYRFTIDVTGGVNAAVLTVEKLGDEPLPVADLKVNGTALAQMDAENYEADIDLVQGAAITLSGADMFTPTWINPDFFAPTSSSSVTLVPLSGKYRIKINTTTKTVDAELLKADGSGVATLDANGHGAVYFVGYGFGSPAASGEPGWNSDKGICIPEFASQIYKVTAKAGLEGDTTPGVRFREDGWNGKIYPDRSWGDLGGTLTLALGTEAYFAIASDGNISMATDVTLEAGATYELTLDLTAGNDHPVLSFEKK